MSRPPSVAPERDRSSTRPLPVVHRLSPGAYYGWFVVGGAFLLSFVAVGIGFYGQTVFLDGLIREKGWSKEVVSGASTLYFIVSGLVGVGVGRTVDRWGARGSIAIGAVVMAGALLALGRIERPGELYLVYAVLAVGFGMTAGVPLNAVLARWFVRRRAFAMSLSQTGVSLGGIVLTPAATLMIATRGIEATTQALAALTVLVMLPITAWVIRWDPVDHGLRADGEGDGSPPALPVGRWRARDAMRTRGFAMMALSFSLILFCQTGLSVHLLHLLRESLPAGVAASGVSLVAFGSILGRLVIGQLADHADKRVLAAVLFGVQALAHASLSVAEGPVALFGGALVFGLTIGSVFMLQSLLVMELFGVPSFGTVFGVLNLVTSIAGGLGPLAVGAVAARAGYPAAVVMLATAAVLGAVAVLQVRAPGPGRS